MNRTELESILKRARLPEIPGESLEMFPRRIVGSLKCDRSSVRSPRHFSPHLAWAFGLMACIIIAFAAGHWAGRKQAGTTLAPDALTSLKLIHETLAMFPNRVRAIVQNEHGLNLVLSDKPDVPDSTPIYVRIQDGGRCSSLVTFSGQELQIAGQKVTVLSQTDGGIILEGSNFFWSDGKPLYAKRNLKIEAKNLDLNTM